MKNTIVICLLNLSLFGLIDLNAQKANPYPATETPDRIILTWEEDPAHSQSVSWRTSTAVTSARGEITPADPAPDFPHPVDTVTAVTTTLESDQDTANYHSVTFKNLKPGKMYMYRVGDGSHYSEWFQFTTASKKSEGFSFLYFGDAQNDLKSLWSRVIRQGYSTAPNIDFMLHAGDLVNRSYRDSEWGEWFYAGGWIFGMKPSIATPGNHEYYKVEEEYSLAAHWRPTFAFPQNGPEGLEETVYYLDYQDTRFISLNTPAAKADDASLKTQKRWLEEVLQTNPGKWIIVTMHHPVYSTAGTRDNPKIRAAFQPLFEKYHVDLVLQGHDHTYGRGFNKGYGTGFQDRGPVYVVSVSGPKMYTLNFDPWLDYTASNTQLYQIISIKGDELVYDAYTTTGERYDGFILKKKNPRKNKFMDTAPFGAEERIDIPSVYLKNMSEDALNEYRAKFKAYKARKKN